MSTVARPQLAHPFAEDLDGLALQLLLLAWVLRSLAPAPATRPGVLLVHADPFGLALAVVRLMPHHRIELSTRPGLEVHVDDVEDLFVEDAEVEVRAYPGVVRAGVGATVWAHPGVVVDAVDGAVIHLAPGASLEECRPGALERADVSVIPWHTSPLQGVDAIPVPEQRCLVCGCTDDLACPGGCWWVALDLCSSCLDVVGQHTVAPPGQVVGP